MTVEELLEDVIARFKKGRIPNLQTTDEAQRIVDTLRKHNPSSLLDWFEQNMVGVLSSNLQVRLAQARRSANGTKSVFGGGGRRGNGGDDTQAPPPSLFDAGFACEGNTWKHAGDMCKPDWEFIIEDRSMRAKASLFDIEYARRIKAKLPDDTTPTRAVLTEAELERMQELAQRKADNAKF